jgi:hypothetical protein
MLETRVQPTYSLDIYIIFISLFTADVFVTYVRDKCSANYSLDIYIIFISLITGDVFVTNVRDKGSTNLFPGHLYNIYLSLQLMCLWPMLETRVQPTNSLDINIIFISLFTADVFVTYVRDKGSANLFPGHLYYIDLSHYSWCVCNLC